MKILDKEDGSLHISKPEEVQRILVVRQHNQLGDLLASSCVFRGIKETFPHAHLTVIVSPQNKDAVLNNPFIDKVYVFNKKQLHLPYCMMNLLSVLNRKYDITFVPFTVSISYTSNLLAKMARTRYRFGVSELEGKENKQAQWFDRTVKLDWTQKPERHIALRSSDFFTHFGVKISDYSAIIVPGEADYSTAVAFCIKHNLNTDKLAGIHCGAGKVPNRWPADRFAATATQLLEKGYSLYLTGSSADEDVIKNVKSGVQTDIPVFMNQSIGELAALIDRSKLFITNDTGIMHVAGAVKTPQISLFGPTPPAVWGPSGSNKINLYKGSDIAQITIVDVLESAFQLPESK